MGTRANIVRKNADESFDMIYTHWDGYPSHHAPILLASYSTSAQVSALLALGDMSVLGEQIGRKHSFQKRSKDPSKFAHPEWCCAYGRDRGEIGTESQHFADAAALKAANDDAWTEWIYMWDEAKQTWYFTNNPSPTWFKCCPREQLTLHQLAQWEQIMEPERTGDVQAAFIPATQ